MNEDLEMSFVQEEPRYFDEEIMDWVYEMNPYEEALFTSDDQEKGV